MKRVKTVNGHTIKVMTREEISKELERKGDWGIEYFVPGRTFEPFVVTVNRLRNRFNTIEEAENFCWKQEKKVRTKK